jgi:cytochrome bd-type quinol oxidase subunit 1
MACLLPPKLQNSGAISVSAFGRYPAIVYGVLTRHKNNSHVDIGLP